MTTRWDPEQYLRFRDERSRPFADLLARVAHPGPSEVVDLGCGPGTTTATLLQRWPRAHVVGIDSSSAMIERAAAVAVPGRLEFRAGDLRDWKPEAPPDVVLSAATLQWVPGHEDLIPSLVASLAPAGVFAFQVPGNFDQPSHALLRDLASTPRWHDLLGGLGRPDPVLHPRRYLGILLATGAEADVWETTYLHVLTGDNAVLEWVRATALRPFLAAIDDAVRSGDEPAGATTEFLDACSAALREAYPPDARGRTVLPFRRIFAVAHVAGA